MILGYDVASDWRNKVVMLSFSSEPRYSTSEGKLSPYEAVQGTSVERLGELGPTHVFCS